MRTGIKSVLFGVHQFLLHPIFVCRAYHRLYKRRPSFSEKVAIFFHDVGYWGCAKMDDADGQRHPILGALWAARVITLWDRSYGAFDYWRWFCETHSRFLAKQLGLEPVPLFGPDKLSVVVYPQWLYFLLAYASGEIHEYYEDARSGKHGPGTEHLKTKKEWFAWLAKVMYTQSENGANVWRGKWNPKTRKVNR